MSSNQQTPTRPVVGMPTPSKEVVKFYQSPAPPGSQRKGGTVSTTRVEHDFGLVHPRTQQVMTPEEIYQSLQHNNERDMGLYASLIDNSVSTLQQAQEEFILRSLYGPMASNKVLSKIVEHKNFEQLNTAYKKVRGEKEKSQKIITNLTHDSNKKGVDWVNYSTWARSNNITVGHFMPAWCSEAFMEIVVLPLIGGDRKRTALEALDKLRMSGLLSQLPPAAVFQALSHVRMIRIAGLYGMNSSDENITPADIKTFVEDENRMDSIRYYTQDPHFNAQMSIKRFVNVHGILWKDGKCHEHYARVMGSGGKPGWSLAQDLIQFPPPPPQTPQRLKLNFHGVPPPPPIVPPALREQSQSRSEATRSIRSATSPGSFRLESVSSRVANQPSTPTPTTKGKEREAPTMQEIEDKTDAMSLSTVRRGSGKRSHPSTTASMFSPPAKKVQKTAEDQQAEDVIESVKQLIASQSLKEESSRNSPTPRSLSTQWPIPIRNPTSIETFAWSLAVKYAQSGNWQERTPRLTKVDKDTILQYGAIPII